jgi:hypothetical protein
MTISSVLFSVGLALLLIYYVTEPLRRRNIQGLGSGDASAREQLLAHKFAILAAIREIDADAQVGKLEKADHQVLRRRYVSEGVAVLKELDALPAEDEVDQAIESDLTRLRSGDAPAAAPAAAGYCHQCGARLDQADKFCAKCGTRVKG